MSIENRIRRLTIRSHISTWGGYGWVVCELFKHLEKMGVYCALRPIAIDESFGLASKIPTQMRGQIVNSRQPEEWEVLLSPPQDVPTPGRKTVKFTMYESSEMPEQYVSLLNRSECVIVPCLWNAAHFAENGVTKPIRVVSLGFDPDVFKQTPVAAHGPTVFGVAGRTRHCAKRKGIQEAIDLFLKTFPTDDSVRLHVKLHHDDIIAGVKDSRIKVERTNFEPYEIAHWLSGITAYLTLARGEGFGLWALQSLACGRPVIGCRYSGQADFMNYANSIIIPHREVDAVSGESNVEYLGRWAEPDTKTAARQMQAIARQRKVAIEIGAAAPATVAELTWENTAKKFVAVLEEMGAL